MARNPMNGGQREKELAGGVIGRGRQDKRAMRETFACRSYTDSSFVSCSRSPSTPSTLAPCHTRTSPRSCFRPRLLLVR